MVLNDSSEAYRLLRELGASNRLLRHAQLVEELAGLIIDQLRSLGIQCDEHLVAAGAVLHDAGKIKQPQELSGPGSLHEEAGQALLLANGIQPELAAFCVSHAGWGSPQVSFEERVVALADKLWKGKRESDLELLIIDEVAARLHASRWELFDVLDSAFENIAARGAERLEQSRTF